MNREQWNGGLKQLKGVFKKQWGRLTGDIVLETMGELERLLGVFQRQYGYLKAQEGSAHRQDGSHAAMDRPRQEQNTLVLIQGNKRSRNSLRRMRPVSPPMELS